MRLLLIVVVVFLSACGNGMTDLEREVKNKNACEQLGGTWDTYKEGFFRGTGQSYPEDTLIVRCLLF